MQRKIKTKQIDKGKQGNRERKSEIKIDGERESMTRVHPQHPPTHTHRQTHRQQQHTTPIKKFKN